uniref:Alternative protein n=1 Tax=Steinernema glaseri TaxID=37863 RepID=A0A1I7ZJM7_9BILA
MCESPCECRSPVLGTEFGSQPKNTPRLRLSLPLRRSKPFMTHPFMAMFPALIPAWSPFWALASPPVVR